MTGLDLLFKKEYMNVKNKMFGYISLRLFQTLISFYYKQFFTCFIWIVRACMFAA